MDHLAHDVRQAFRVLTRERTFSATVLVTLTLCLAANVVVLGVVYAILLAPLPFSEPDRLVVVTNSYPGAGVARASNGIVDFFERRENIRAFQEVAIYQGSGHTVGEVGATEQVASLRVTPSFFPLLGITPALGRPFLEDEMERGNHFKVILTHAAWQELFGGSADVVGRDLRMDGRPYAVVGVLAEDFSLPGNADARVIVPLAFEPSDRDVENWHNNSYEMLARLAPGATVEQARSQNLALNDDLTDRWGQPNARQLLQDVGYTTLVEPAASDMVRDVRPVLYLLWAGVAFVLLIGCVNIANLMLARAQARLGEVATRLALGASRRRVAASVFTEAITLGIVGGIAGLALGAAGIRGLATLGAADLPRGTEIGLDLSVVIFGIAIAVTAGAVFGAIPVASVMRGDLSQVFRAGGRSGTASRSAVRVRNGLVVSQVGLAFVMLMGSGLMLASFRSAVAVDPGFDPDRVLAGFVALPTIRYADDDARQQFWDGLLADVRAIPDVEAAAITTQLPFTGNNSSSVILPEGYVPPEGESLIAPSMTISGPGYLDALGIQLVEGRDFAESDGGDATRVMLIDEWLADRYWPSGGAVGSRMVYNVVPGEPIPPENVATVIGVVRTIKHQDLTTPSSEHVGAYYFTYRQRTQGFVALAVRTRSDDPSSVAPLVRAALARRDPELPFFDVQTMATRIDESLATRRVPLVVLGAFAGVALFLAMIGIYGALSYSVSQRRREIGIRIAIGSAPQQVFRTVVAQGMRVTVLGLALGVGAAYSLARLVESLLFGVGATDLRVMAGVALVLTLVATAASAVPARRATRVNPVEALGG